MPWRSPGAAPVLGSGCGVAGGGVGARLGDQLAGVGGAHGDYKNCFLKDYFVKPELQVFDSFCPRFS